MEEDEFSDDNESEFSMINIIEPNLTSEFECIEAPKIEEKFDEFKHINIKSNYFKKNPLEESQEINLHKLKDEVYAVETEDLVKIKKENNRASLKRIKNTNRKTEDQIEYHFDDIILDEDYAHVNEASPSNSNDLRKKGVPSIQISNMSKESCLQSADSSFLVISTNDEIIPAHYQDKESYIQNVKGAIYEGLTNIGFYLSDTGFMGVLGINKLEFDNPKAKIWLFNERFKGSQKVKFMNEFRKLIWFSYRNGFEGLLNRK